MDTFTTTPNQSHSLPMKKIAWIAFTLALIGPAANAAPVKGGYCIALSFTGADAVFNCEHIGKVTFKQIYEKGWRIVSYTQLKDSPTMRELIIEEQR